MATYIEINPQKVAALDTLPAEYMAGGIGFIPEFVEFAEAANKPLAAGIIEAYGFPVTPLDGGEVGEDKFWHYPQDPSLPPLAQLTSDKGVVLIYQYGLVAIKDGHHDEPFVMYLMD